MYCRLGQQILLCNDSGLISQSIRAIKVHPCVEGLGAKVDAFKNTLVVERLQFTCTLCNHTSNVQINLDPSTTLHCEK